MDLNRISGQTAAQPFSTAREVKGREPVSGAAPTAGEKGRQSAPVYDEYVPEDKSVKQSAGLYRLGHDEDGSPRVDFDPPEDADAPEDTAETTTINTDEVDREIESLKEERQRLERQLDTADPQDAEALRRQLAQVEQELRQKDNDAYRRRNAAVS